MKIHLRTNLESVSKLLFPVGEMEVTVDRKHERAFLRRLFLP